MPLPPPLGAAPWADGHEEGAENTWSTFSTASRHETPVPSWLHATSYQYRDVASRKFISKMRARESAAVWLRQLLESFQIREHVATDAHKSVSKRCAQGSLHTSSTCCRWKR